MHRTTRIWLCRLAFLFLAMGPTGLVFGIVAQRYWPGGAERFCRELSLATGGRVRCRGIQFPLPGVVVLSQVEFANPETGVVLAHCRTLEIHRHSAGYSLEVSQGECEAAGLPTLVEMLHDRTLRAEASLLPGMQLSANALLITRKEHRQTLHALRITYGGSTAGPQLVFQFGISGEANGAPCEIRLTRHRELTPPVTRCDFHTGPQAVPLELAREWLPELAILGSAAEFQGEASALRMANGWTGECRGNWTKVDLNQLISQRFPHQVNGLASIQFEPLAFEAGRLLHARGQIGAGPGAIGSSLLVAAGEHFQLELSPRVSKTASGLVPYRQLSMDFLLNEGSLHVRGTCEKSPCAIVADDEGSLLASRGIAERSTVALVRTLAPQSGVQAPATEETRWLMQSLSLPAVVPRENQLAKPPRAHVRWPEMR